MSRERVSYGDKQFGALNRQVYEDGAKAKRQGKDIVVDQPYEPESRLWLAWRHGFKFGNE